MFEYSPITTFNFSDTSKVEDYSYCFKRCNITSIPEGISFESAKNCYGMFQYTNLTGEINLTMPNATTINSMFANTKISKLSITAPNAIYIGYVVENCDNLINLKINVGKVQSLSGAFSNCPKLENVPTNIDTSECTNYFRTFCNMSKLKTVPNNYNASKSTDFSDTFYGCRSLTSIGMYGFTRSIDISPTALEHDAIVAFLNQAGIAYNNSQRITMGSAKLALLTDEEKAIATNKGWTLA